jgi:cell filamentation protein
MALQVGLPFLSFDLISDELRSDYFGAVQEGMDRNYAPMAALFFQLIERSIGRASE